MATDTFTACVRIGASAKINVPVIEAQFGDGYKQIAGNGINPRYEEWTLSCNGDVLSMAKIRKFLESHVTRSFWWENPWGDKKLYRVKADSIEISFPNGNFAEIGFIFQQAFSP